MIRRHITKHIIDALSDTPVVFLRGPRQAGKSTLVQAIADGPYSARYVTLDNAGVRSAASSDPTGFIAGIEKPVIIDEAQRVPGLLLAIKEDVDRNRQPGRYLLTGSADVLTVPRVADALVGRMEILTLWPLSLGEINGSDENLVDAFFSLEFPQRFLPPSEFDFETSIVAGGFPEPVQRKTAHRRQAWFESYITTMLDRDIRDLAQIQDVASVPRLLKLLAHRMATLHNQSEISRSSGIPNSTLSRYMALLKTTFLIHELPAWSSNLGKRLVKAPKLMMLDTGLACYLAGVNEAGLRRREDVAGRVFENFVAIELFKHASWSDETVRLFHFRSQTGREVDIVVENRSGDVVGVEVKLTSTPSRRDFSGLDTLQEHLGKKFLRGILIYTGKDIIPFGERLHAVPAQHFCIHRSS
jgi:predicted AAA+ superfamily ATPase